MLKDGGIVMTIPLSYAMADVLILTNHFSSIVPNIIEKLLRYLAPYGRYYVTTYLLLRTFSDKNVFYLASKRENVKKQIPEVYCKETKRFGKNMLHFGTICDIMYTLNAPKT